MHYYPFNPSAYYLSTGHWSEDRTEVACEAGLLRDLAYRRLLDLYYGEEEPIPSKTRLVAIRIRMLKHEEIVASVLKEKFSLIDGFWRQERADDEIAKYQRRAEASRENGRKGGRPRNQDGTQKNLAGSGQAPTKNHKPRTRNHIPPTPQMGEWFERWYALYPLKKARQDALKAFVRLLPDAELFDTLMRAIQAQVAAGHFTNVNGQVVPPYPATWLNGRRWEEEPQGNASASPPGAAQNEPAWRTEQRQRTQIAAPGVAAAGPAQNPNEFFIDAEVKRVTAG